MPKPHTYAKIPIQLRRQLVYWVLEQGSSIAQTARLLNIKKSTAKLITNTYFQPKNSRTLQDKPSDRESLLVKVQQDGNYQLLKNENQQAEQHQKEIIHQRASDNEEKAMGGLTEGFFHQPQVKNQQTYYWIFTFTNSTYNP